MNIEQIISLLIHRFDCVIIPGFGGFMNNIMGRPYLFATLELQLSGTKYAKDNGVKFSTNMRTKNDSELLFLQAKK